MGRELCYERFCRDFGLAGWFLLGELLRLLSVGWFLAGWFPKVGSDFPAGVTAKERLRQ